MEKLSFPTGPLSLQSLTFVNMAQNHSALIACGFVVLALIGYGVYQNKGSDTDMPIASSTITSTEEAVELNSEITAGDVEAQVNDVDSTEANPEGIHIMADGKVMNKDGKEIIDATISSDGNVQLADGTVVIPAFDLRTPSDSQSTQVTPKPNEHVVIDIAGINYEYDIKEIRVKKGDTVTINFKSDQGFHDWVVDEFSAATDRVSEKDGITSVTFVADKVGTFQYYCSVMTHRQMGMIGYLIVEER